MQKVLRIKDVEAQTGLSRTSIWRLERLKNFPARLRLGMNSVGWLEDDISEWLRERPRGMTRHQATGGQANVR
jgi:prophage regulatory protein